MEEKKRNRKRKRNKDRTRKTLDTAEEVMEAATLSGKKRLCFRHEIKCTFLLILHVHVHVHTLHCLVMIISLRSLDFGYPSDLSVCWKF